MLLDFLKSLSIKHKLVLTIIGISSFVLLLSFAIFISLELNSVKKSMLQDLSTLAELVGKNSSGAVMFQDNKTAEENLLSLKAKPQVMSAFLFDVNSEGVSKSEYFAQYQSIQPSPKINFDPRIIQYINSQSRGNIIINDHIHLVNPIILEQDKSTIGMIYLISDRTIYWQQVNHYLVTIFFMLIFAILLTILITFRAQKIFTKPLLQLISSMKNISKTHDYDELLENTYHDEFGLLISGFNEMLFELNKQRKMTLNYQDDLEYQVKERTAQLQKARDDALSASRSKSTFLASMSHEIKTPMTAILGYTNLLQQRKLTTEDLEYLQIIDKSGKHLLGLINEILELSKMEAGTYKLNLTEFDLYDVLMNIKDMFTIICQNKKIGWAMKSFTHEPIRVIGDQGKINQVLINLIGNACKFTNEGEVAFSLSLLNRDTYRFSVIDSGIGIKKEALKSIFTAFHQEKDGAKKGGTGLGLNISQHHVHLMSSQIHVESTEGVGTTFYFDLRLKEATNQELEVPIAVTRSSIALSAKKKLTALIVDDNEENIYVLSVTLSQMGYAIVSANNGQQALEKIEKKCPDIVFMDIHMPVMNGLEAISHIREKYTSEELKCVAMSASSGDQKAEFFVSHGFDFYIIKPFTIDVIVQTLNNAFDKTSEIESPIEALVIEPSKAPLISLKKGLKKRLIEYSCYGQLTELSEELPNLLQYGADGERASKEIDVLIKEADLEKIIAYIEQLTS